MAHMRRFFFLVAAAWAGSAAALWGADRPSFTLCSYNLRNYVRMERFVDGSKQPDQPKPLKEIEPVIRFMGEIKPDILGVCEIGDDQDLADLQSRLKAAGIDLPNAEHTSGSDSVRMLGLLTRFPIVRRNSQTELRYRIGSDIVPVQRGILDATVQVRPGYYLRCIGVHLKSQRPVPEWDQALMRRNEAHVLRLYIDKILTDAPAAQLVVYGDFNDQKNTPSIQEIEGARGITTSLNALDLQDSYGERWTHYWKEADLYSRLDYVFFSHGMTGYVNHQDSYIFSAPDYYEGSDHRPLVAKFYLKRR